MKGSSWFCKAEGSQHRPVGRIWFRLDTTPSELQMLFHSGNPKTPAPAPRGLCNKPHLCGTLLAGVADHRSDSQQRPLGELIGFFAIVLGRTTNGIHSRDNFWRCTGLQFGDHSFRGTFVLFHLHTGWAHIAQQLFLKYWLLHWLMGCHTTKKIEQRYAVHWRDTKFEIISANISRYTNVTTF